MGDYRRGRVRPGITGFHPGLQQALIPGMEHDVPVQDWSEELFEVVAASIDPLPAGEPVSQPEAPPSWRRPRVVDDIKEG